MEIPGKLVVRTYAPARRWTMLASALLLGVVALYLAFEFGRQKAGFDGIQAAQQRAGLEGQIASLQSTIHDMQVQLAAADEAKVAQVRERSEVAKTIGELQAALGRAQQDLEFYRGIANPVAGARPQPVRVQQFQVLTADAAARSYTLRFALNRPTRPEESTTGTLGVTLEGERAGAAASIDLAMLTDGKQRELSYSFRYYSNVEQLVTVPADFRPERVTIEIRPARKGLAPYRQTFVWNPDVT
ncbi:MAG: hypothetical protein KGL25_13830 [Gammaproteobacteria bacterium]|nr:hypothetical protein [Gammaproteobacteria bacterium]